MTVNPRCGNALSLVRGHREHNRDIRYSDHLHPSNHVFNRVFLVGIFLRCAIGRSTIVGFRFFRSFLFGRVILGIFLFRLGLFSGLRAVLVVAAGTVRGRIMMMIRLLVSRRREAVVTLLELPVFIDVALIQSNLHIVEDI